MSLIPRTFRIVRSRNPEEVRITEDLLAAQGFGFSSLPFAPWARVLLEGRMPLGSSIANRFGLIYIQDRSSMLPPLLLDPAPGSCVLDLCASPGSKTGILAETVGREGLVLANEPARDRLETLKSNLTTLGHVQTVFSSYPGESIPLVDGSWSYILADVPCSAWGTIEVNPQAARIWHDGNIQPLIALQRKLLRRAAELLRPGGKVMYSTCTTNVAENEEQVAWACSELGLKIVALPQVAGFCFSDPLIDGCAGCLRVDGEKSEAQGFFLALLEKEGGSGDCDLEAAGFKGKVVDLGRLSDPREVCFNNLPPGDTAVFKDLAVFIPKPVACCIPAGFGFQGMILGAVRGRKFYPDRNLSLLLPAYDGQNGIDCDSAAPVENLLKGQSLYAQKETAGRGLYFRGLPLAYLARKGNRLLISN